MLLTHHTPDGLRRSRQHSLTLYGLADGVLPVDLARDLDEVARTARTFLGADAAFVNLLPGDRQVTVASTAVDAPVEVPASDSICATLLEQRPVDTICIPDLTLDPRFRTSPFVDGTYARLRGFASAPLTGREGVALGTLCAAWTTPRAVRREEAALLVHLGRAAVNLLDDGRHRQPREVTTFPARPLAVATRVCVA